MCAENSLKFKELFDLAQINYDDYIRTVETRHKENVHNFWNELKDKNLIKSKEYEGYYSVADESFIPIKDLVEVKSAEDEKAVKYTTKLGQAVEFLTENTYSMSFQNCIEDYKLAINDDRLLFNPKSIVNEVNEYINSQLFDLSISRPSNRVSWGIPVPNDQSQVIYVWFEALINYLTVVKDIMEKINIKSHENVEFIHVIGKDISKFHCYFWPNILIANNYKVKINILMHSHWLKNSVSYL